MSELYPITPGTPPVYQAQPRTTTGRRFGLFALLDVAFIIVALVLTMWFAGVLLLEGLSLTPVRMLLLVVFWAVTAYLALPRLHQLFTEIYLPDYFMGRTKTGDGLLGDPVNLALDGSEADIHAAMQRAGWTLADEITLRSAGRIIWSTLSRTSYAQAPVSSLFLFGRRQAFAYQQEVDGNAAQRHHVRFWRVPEGWVLPGGHHAEWLAAGTYDRSVGFSLFTGQITHKIDANIDAERDYIIDTVRYADPRCGVRVIEEFSTAYHARNGGGDAVQTDGDLPVLDVAGAAMRAGDAPVTHPAHLNEPGDHHVPPFSVLFTGLLLLPNIAFGILGALEVWNDPEIIADGRRAQVLAASAMVAIGLLYLALWLLIVRRGRWARLLLMVLLTLDTAFNLSGLSFTRADRFSDLLITGMSALGLLAITGDAARAWVSKGRTNPTVTLGS